MTEAGHRVTHLGLCVSDVERSRRFYVEALGFREVGRMGASGEATATILSVPDADLDLLYMERDGLRLELIGYKAGVTGDGAPRPMDQLGFTHLSVRVDDVDALCKEITAHGGTVLPETEVTFEWGNRGIMALDPDGARIELIERRPE